MTAAYYSGSLAYYAAIPVRPYYYASILAPCLGIGLYKNQQSNLIVLQVVLELCLPCMITDIILVITLVERANLTLLVPNWVSAAIRCID